MTNYEHNGSQQETDHRTEASSRDLGSVSLAAAVELEQEKTMFDLTEPESRIYSPYEKYRFLVHVPLHGIEQRAAEIGSERNGALMTSLVSHTRQATFEGQGGIIVAQPAEITGSTVHDNGDVIMSGEMASVDELLRPSTNDDYNQIDMAFAATTPVGVMVKRAATDGRELGTPYINSSLRAYAAEHSLPVVEVIVLPDDSLPTEPASETHTNAEGTSLVTATIPGGDEYYFKAQVLRGRAYHTEVDDIAARVMKITAYGETIRDLTPDERGTVLSTLETMAQTDGSVTESDIAAIRSELS